MVCSRELQLNSVNESGDIFNDDILNTMVELISISAIKMTKDAKGSDVTETKVSETNDSIPEVKHYKSRFFHLLIMSLGCMLSDVTYSQYSIIANVLTDYYDTNYITVEWTSMTYLVGYILPAYPTIILVEKKGLKFAFVTGLILVAIGLWVQGVGTQIGLFWLILLGQCLVSVTQCCFVNLMPQFASYWFDSSEVSTACACGVFSNVIGMGLSCVIPTMLVNHFPSLSIGIKLTYLNYTTATLTTLLIFLSIFGFKERPPNPPSEAQAQIWNLKKENELSPSKQLCQEIKNLVKNKNFIVHLISASLMISFQAFAVILLNQLLIIKYPNSINDIGAIGLVMYFIGIPGTLVCGLIVDKTHKYKETTCGVNICMFLSLCFFAGSIYINLMSVYVAAVFMGFFMIGYVNLGLEMASEISYPVSEVVAASMVLFFGNLMGIAMTYISNWLLLNYSLFVSLGVLLLYCFIGMLISAFVKSDLRRMKASQLH